MLRAVKRDSLPVGARCEEFDKAREAIFHIGVHEIDTAAKLIAECRSLVITTGAGMGVDSGLPDFRGDTGFWKAYPLYKSLGYGFVDMATPSWFDEDPEFAWGFYGHRLNLYRNTKPHTGFDVLRKWISDLNLSWFAVTSNVDGQFQKAGFAADRIVEIHGSIHHLQCQRPCGPDLWTNDLEVEVDLSTMRSSSKPQCRNCGEVARPNILMFGDFSYISTRARQQQQLFERYLASAEQPMVVVEIGAGKAIPTIRWTSESLAKEVGAKIIRINVREPEVRAPHVSLALGGADALQQIDAALEDLRRS